MKKDFDAGGASLFTIEQIPSVPSSVKQLSGCALCEHCTLLRLMVQSRLDRRDGVCSHRSTTKSITK